MSNVSIYEKNWTDLVFEDRNKDYGAYQLRQENGKTTLLALFIGVLFFFTVIGSWMLFSSFGSNVEPITQPAQDDDRLILVDLAKTPPPTKPAAIKPLVQKQAAAPVKLINNSNFVVAPTIQAQVDIPTTASITNQTNDGPTSPTGSIDVPPGNGAPSGAITAPSGGSDAIRTSVELDRLPEYPGGIKKFYEYVGSSIEKSEIDSNSSTVSVIMGFVIEKDGSMSNIRCLRSSDKNLEKEAIRVLKSLKIKWSPGYLDNQKVRTQYTLPIKVTI